MFIHTCVCQCVVAGVFSALVVVSCKAIVKFSVLSMRKIPVQQCICLFVVGLFCRYINLE